MTEPATQVKEFLKRWPKFYYFIYVFLGPLYFGGLGPKKFLSLYHKDGVCLNLGSGNRRISSEVVNVDFIKYPEVDVVSDLAKLPYSDESVDSIISTEVLEHVYNMDACVDEIFRILKSGGYGYISVPLLYPFHASPSDYRRWTHVGLEDAFKDFEIVKIGVRSGPFSTLTTLLCYMTATIFSFGNEKLYWLLIYVSMFVYFPIKFIDIIVNRLPFAINSASLLYCVVRKK